MPNQRSSGKAFYLLLTAILGALLFIVIQRALALIYYLLLNTNYQTYSLGMDYYQLSWVNFLTFFGAIFFGLWYGIWLGLHWFDVVYEQGPGGLFHSFRGRFLHHEKVLKPEETKPSASSSGIIEKLQHDSWDFDDLAQQESDPVVTKTVRPKAKSVTKRKNGTKRSTTL